MRTALCLALLGLGILTGCGLSGLAGGDLFGSLQGLGPTVCTAYDFNGDGIVTVAEVQQVFGDTLSSAEITEALNFYGCKQQ
jgi:hypothetical protein